MIIRPLIWIACICRKKNLVSRINISIVDIYNFIL
jgi:hypothetical protein